MRWSKPGTKPVGGRGAGCPPPWRRCPKIFHYFMYIYTLGEVKIMWNTPRPRACVGKFQIFAPHPCQKTLASFLVKAWQKPSFEFLFQIAFDVRIDWWDHYFCCHQRIICAATFIISKWSQALPKICSRPWNRKCQIWNLKTGYENADSWCYMAIKSHLEYAESIKLKLLFRQNVSAIIRNSKHPWNNFTKLIRNLIFIKKFSSNI